MATTTQTTGGTPASVDDSLLLPFRGKEPHAVRLVEALVERIIASRGYYIPAPERGDVAQQAMLEIWRTVTRQGFRCRSFKAVVRTVTSPFKVLTDTFKRT